MRTLIAAAAATLALAGAASSASAESVTVRIDYSDLDLTSTADQAKLEQRIEVAVDDACQKPGIRNLRGRSYWRACREAAYGAAQDEAKRTVAMAKSDSADS